MCLCCPVCLFALQGIAIDPSDGTVFVVDSSNFRLQASALQGWGRGGGWHPCGSSWLCTQPIEVAIMHNCLLSHVLKLQFLGRHC